MRNAEGNAGQPAFTLRQHWGATKSGRGHQKHATYSISFESYTLNTGESARDVKESGKVSDHGVNSLKINELIS